MIGKDPKAPAAEATWWDHHQLNFWLWACLRDAGAYLRVSHEYYSQQSITPNNLEAHRELEQKRLSVQRNIELERYHFLTALGSLLRVLKRAQHLFPSIQPAYSRANHLLTEGALLRGMIEHVDDYEAGRGNHQDKFIRELDRLGTLTGDRKATIDATSIVIDNDGHWLGGRFNVERAIMEIIAIQDEANKIPPPD